MAKRPAPPMKRYPEVDRSDGAIIAAVFCLGILALLAPIAMSMNETPRSICEGQGKIYIGDGLCISQDDALDLIRTQLNP
ncbi:hypothetical protein [Celeribacter halophilus]|uniref:Uncharacterized protein n=1 Tax=Celeribacter halophilus TaxID=576117 RepID=A0A1I3X579_9RHOB|nr:hypothetical protein [Celeribacter halophilus]PZX03790.1 hypothetical protein LX82_03737 [Celeribacter halophilus]SFK14753.1 hypothetical protein SAMN04488138_1408 [Celeribacter halophilus]